MSIKRIIIIGSVALVSFAIGKTNLLNKLFERSGCGADFNRVDNFESSVPIIKIKLSDSSEVFLNKQLSFYQKNGLLANNFGLGNQYTSAVFQIENESQNVRVKVKGRYPDNYRNNKAFSMKVKLRNGDDFSLSPVSTKGYIGEWLINQILKEEGLPYYDVKLVKVQFQDSEYLAYKILAKPFLKDEQIEKTVRFNNDKNFSLSVRWWWNDADNLPFLGLKYKGGWEETQKTDFKYSFNKREFDRNELAKTLALLNLLNRKLPGHGLTIHNVHFYERQKGEIGVVCNDHNNIEITTPTGLQELMANNFYGPFLKDPEFCKLFNKAIKHYSDSTVINGWNKLFSEDLSFHMKELKQQFPCYSFKWDVLKINARSLRKMAKNKLDTVEGNDHKFIVNFGQLPTFVSVKDSQVVLYPKNDILWRNHVRLD